MYTPLTSRRCHLLQSFLLRQCNCSKRFGKVLYLVDNLADDTAVSFYAFVAIARQFEQFVSLQRLERFLDRIFLQCLHFVFETNKKITVHPQSQFLQARREQVMSRGRKIVCVVQMLPSLLQRGASVVNSFEASEDLTYQRKSPPCLQFNNVSVMPIRSRNLLGEIDDRRDSGSYCRPSSECGYPVSQTILFSGRARDCLHATAIDDQTNEDNTAKAVECPPAEISFKVHACNPERPNAELCERNKDTQALKIRRTS